MRNFNEAIHNLADEIDRLENIDNQLCERLAKANERVEELEDGNKRLMDCVVHYGDTGANGEALNKFALEQKIEILEELLGRTCPVSGPVVPDKQSRDTLQDHIEQLRKEQEKC